MPRWAQTAAATSTPRRTSGGSALTSRASRMRVAASKSPSAAAAWARRAAVARLSAPAAKDSSKSMRASRGFWPSALSPACSSSAETRESTSPPCASSRASSPRGCPCAAYWLTSSRCRACTRASGTTSSRARLAGPETVPSGVRSPACSTRPISTSKFSWPLSILRCRSEGSGPGSTNPTDNASNSSRTPVPSSFSSPPTGSSAGGTPSAWSGCE